MVPKMPFGRLVYTYSTVVSVNNSYCVHKKSFVTSIHQFPPCIIIIIILSFAHFEQSALFSLLHDQGLLSPPTYFPLFYSSGTYGMEHSTCSSPEH